MAKKVKKAKSQKPKSGSKKRVPPHKKKTGQKPNKPTPQGAEEARRARFEARRETLKRLAEAEWFIAITPNSHQGPRGINMEKEGVGSDQDFLMKLQWFLLYEPDHPLLMQLVRQLTPQLHQPQQPPPPKKELIDGLMDEEEEDEEVGDVLGQDTEEEDSPEEAEGEDGEDAEGDEYEEEDEEDEEDEE